MAKRVDFCAFTCFPSIAGELNSTTSVAANESMHERIGTRGTTFAGTISVSIAASGAGGAAAAALSVAVPSDDTYVQAPASSSLRLFAASESLAATSLELTARSSGTFTPR